MNYTTPKEFATLLDRTFLKYISLPILFFFVYYCYFNYNQGKGVLLEPELESSWIFSYIAFWSIPLFILFKKKTKMVELMSDEKLMEDKLKVLMDSSKRNYWFILVLFLIAILVFCLTNHPLVSFPVWVMIIVVSIEKPTIYRIGKSLRFKTKDEYMTFINDVWP